jgi:hypothetical protein
MKRCPQCNRVETDDALTFCRRYVQGYALAIIYIGLNEKEEALNWLEKEISDRSSTAVFYGISPDLDDLRSEPRFKAMLKRLNLPE